ncbi:helix-turn-helix transcriptional regulator [Mycobacterium sp. Root265]|uniref:helix-turn-helix transcriptional regulator n=1 Tax=Mycobacterium sp. Root265 TaxID=1736504 RepID=UPI0012E3D95B|nr:helix-turn-helix domain-containing protein [Mycobacterium sp. Root265]
MTTKDVENEYGIPEGTLRYYRSTGIGPASFRLGGRVRYRRADVLIWVAEQERTTRRGGTESQQSSVDAR